MLKKIENRTHLWFLSCCESGVTSLVLSSRSWAAFWDFLSFAVAFPSAGDDTAAPSSSSESNGFMSCLRVMSALPLSDESCPGVSLRAGELRAESDRLAAGDCLSEPPIPPGDNARPDGGTGRRSKSFCGDLTVLVGLVRARFSLLGDLEMRAFFISRPYISDEIRAFWSVSNSPTVYVLSRAFVPICCISSVWPVK